MSRRPVRDSVARLVRRTGYEIVSSRRLAHWHFAEHLGQLFAALEIDCVLDVGANRGQFVEFLRRDVGYAGRIVSFEPIAELAAALVERARDDAQWDVRQEALGSEDAEADLNVMASDNFSSFLRPSAGIVDAFDEWNKVARVERVRVRRLESIFDEVRDGHDRVFLKLDTQGHDLPAIRGAGRRLDDVLALQTELSVLPIYEGAVPLTEALTELTGLGFHVTGMFPVNRDKDLRVIEFDCVMRRV